MPAIRKLMKRLGFVRLNRFGLLLTPEGRIMSLRPTVLDDGLGNKIVGWQDGDLAAMELETWEPARPASQRAVASRVASVPASPVPMVAVIPPRPAPVVASEPVVDEDEWEWEIAMARARATAADVLAAVPPTKPPPIPSRTLPMPVVDPISTGSWPKTEPLGNIDYDDYMSPTTEVVQTVRVAEVPVSANHAPAPQAVRPGTSPVTVIPVPKLPSLRAGGRIEPLPRRFPKGTGPVDSNHMAPDQTKPGIVLPRAASAIALPSVKQRTASRG